MYCLIKWSSSKLAKSIRCNDAPTQMNIKRVNASDPTREKVACIRLPCSGGDHCVVYHHDATD